MNEALIDDKTGASYLFYRYRDNAKNRGIDFQLSVEDISSMIHEPCWFCGAVDTNTARTILWRGRVFKYNGIDRLDSTAGYTIDNCRPACFRCNRAKSNMNESQFLQMVSAIYNNRMLT